MGKNILDYLGKKIVTGAVITYLAFCGAGCMGNNKSEEVLFSGRNPSNGPLENLIVNFTKPLSGCLRGFDSVKIKSCEFIIFPDPGSSSYVDEQRSAAGGHEMIWYSIYPPIY